MSDLAQALEMGRHAKLTRQLDALKRELEGCTDTWNPKARRRRACLMNKIKRLEFSLSQGSFPPV